MAEPMHSLPNIENLSAHENISTQSSNFEGRFQHIDFVGSLAQSNGNGYILAIIDKLTRWPEAYPLREISATVVAKTFVNKYMSRFGVAQPITSKQGA